MRPSAESAPEAAAMDASPPTVPASAAADAAPAPGDEDLLPGGPAPADPPASASPERRAPRTLDPSARAALSFPGADRVICGMTLPVAPT